MAENIFLGRVPVKNGVVQWKQMFRDAKTYMDMVGLDVPANMFMHNLSASQCQMVCIARALSRNPKILVLDEPTSPLTEKEVEALFQILFKLRDRGISCIYISHKMKEIMRLADRVCVMRDGQHIWTKDASELTIDAIVESMVNRKIGNMYPKEVFELGEEVFSVKNLKIKHPYNKKKNIVNGIDLSVRRGEILGLVGLVGSGRSETVNAIMGNMACTYDEMVLEGKAIRIREPGDAIGLGIAMLSEDRKVNGFVPSLDVAKNISLARLDKVSDKGLMKKNVENEFGRQYIKKLNIKVRDEHDNVNNLSGGNQQKVVLPSVKQATAAGIPVFCTSNLPESDEDYITCIGTENFAYGQTAIDMIAEAAGGKANILVMVGALTTTNQAEMLQGMRDRIDEKYPDIKIVDAVAETIDNIIAGDEWATMAQNFFKRGYESVRMAYEYYTSGGTAEFPKYVDSGTVLITAENASTYEDDLWAVICTKGTPWPWES